MALPAPARLTVLLLAGCAGAPAGTHLAPDSLLARYDWQRPQTRCTLPATLDEASGLTDDGAGGLLVIHDNDSTVYRLSCDAGAVPISNVPLDGDFEGLARDGDRLFLLTSPGLLYTAALDPARRRLRGALQPLGSAAAGQCGFEGIAAAADATLWLVCKYPREPQAGTIVLFRVHRTPRAAEPVRLDVRGVLEDLGVRRLRPSGLARVAGSGRLLVLVGKERVLLEWALGDGIIAWQPLSRRLHRQAEGLTLLPDGRIAIVDEADGRRATLTIYAPR